MSDSRSYVEQLAGVMGEDSVFTFILANGREFQPDAGTFRGRRRTPRQCFANATRMAVADQRLTYVEGYVTAVIPIHHAWLLEPDGTILDPTLRVGEYPPRDYFGVPFSTEYLIRASAANGVYGLLGMPSKTLQALVRGEEHNWRVS